MAIVQLNCKPLLASVRHGLTVCFYRGCCVSPAWTVQALVLENTELSLADPVSVTKQHE